MDHETPSSPLTKEPYLVRTLSILRSSATCSGCIPRSTRCSWRWRPWPRERSFPIVGRLVGSFLHMLALASGARRVFELGSGFGYSTWWLARAVGPEGRVYATDGDPDHRLRAQGFLARAGLWERVHFEVGLALAMLERTDGLFDVIFNDVDKAEYPEVWRQARRRLAPGGLYIADNVLWGGRVLFDSVEEEPVPGGTEAVKEHNRLIALDPGFDLCVNPLRDGVIVARKRGT